MTLTEIQLLERKKKIENKIRDSINQIHEYIKTQSFLINQSVLDLIPMIETVDIPIASVICENTRNKNGGIITYSKSRRKKKKLFNIIE